MIWKTIVEERAQRKWPSWSAHFAWGGLLVFAGRLQAALGWALLFSVVCGFAWEIGYAMLADPKLPANRASVVDWGCWILGALAAVGIAVAWGVD